MTTSREIARVAGVSQTTVSRVIQGSHNVSAKTAARVLAVMKELDYFPNALARAMRTKRSGIIGVATGQITNPWYPAFLEDLAQRVREANLQMTV